MAGGYPAPLVQLNSRTPQAVVRATVLTKLTDAAKRWTQPPASAKAFTPNVRQM